MPEPQFGRWLALSAVLCVPLAGCQEQFPNEKPVFPVNGVVVVDGVPQEGIQVVFHDDNGLDVGKPTFTTGFTDANGKLVVSTYATADGAPAGNYHLTFLWGQVDPLSMSYGGPDKLQGRYSDVEESEITIQISEDRENNLGELELTTQ